MSVNLIRDFVKASTPTSSAAFTAHGAVRWLDTDVAGDGWYGYVVERVEPDGVHVVGRRADGYHLLQTVFQLLDRGDSVRLRLDAGSTTRFMSAEEETVLILQEGRGTFTATLDRYDDVPAHLAEKVIEAHRKEAEAAGH